METPDTSQGPLSTGEDERDMLTKHYANVSANLASRNRIRDPLTGRGTGGTPAKGTMSFMENFYKTTPLATRVRRDHITRGSGLATMSPSKSPAGSLSDWNKFMTRNIKSTFIHTDRVAGRAMPPMSSYNGGVTMLWTKARETGSPSRTREVRNMTVAPGGDVVTL